MHKKIVVSAVNLVEGGPLTILQKCLEALSLYSGNEISVIAIINNENICQYSNIEYIYLSWPKKSWLYRLYFEYIYSWKLSKRLKPYLWLSLHDMTPNVKANLRAVYCHNATPFYHPAITDIRFNYKEFLFSLFYRYLYQINIHKNDFIIVQQEWLKKSFVNMFNLDRQNIIIAKPLYNINISLQKDKNDSNYCLFFFPSFPRVFKNFEVICEACAILEENGILDYKVVFTLNGTENLYAKHIYRKYHHLKNISFCGLLPQECVFALYEQTDCLIFPSKLESWGLPISEYAVLERPMLVADLPYAHETAIGAKKVCFFNPNNPTELANRMEEVIKKIYSNFVSIPTVESDSFTATSWKTLFDMILKSKAYDIK